MSVVTSQLLPPFELAERRARRDRSRPSADPGHPYAVAPAHAGPAAHGHPVAAPFAADRLSAGEYRYPEYLGTVIASAAPSAPPPPAPVYQEPVLTWDAPPRTTAVAVAVAAADDCALARTLSVRSAPDPVRPGGVPIGVLSCGPTETDGFSPWAALPWPWRPPALAPVGLDVLARVVAGLERLGNDRI